MRRTKFLLALFLSFLLIVLAACSFDSPAANTNSTKSDISNQITVYDYLSREVVIPDKVERIACLYAFTGHVVTMLGEGDKIVAVNNGLHRDTLLNEINPAIQHAIVPNRGDKINIEELASINPELIFIQESTAKDEGEVRKLQELNIPYLVVSFNSIKEQQQAIAMIGKALGKTDKAKKYNDFYNETISQVFKVVKDIPEQSRIRVYHSVNEATRTDAADSLPAEWTEIAGTINVSVNENLKLMDGKYFANLEEILLWNPEVIIVNENGVADYILENPQWATLQAVKNKKVYQLPNGLSRWGHPGGLETPLAILWTAKTLYPEKFPETIMQEITTKFYQEFFNYELTEDYIEKILSGKNMRTPKSQ